MSTNEPNVVQAVVLGYEEILWVGEGGRENPDYVVIGPAAPSVPEVVEDEHAPVGVFFEPRSSAIATILYSVYEYASGLDNKTGRLYVTYKSNRNVTYSYLFVNQKDWDAIYMAESMGAELSRLKCSRGWSALKYTCAALL